MTTSATVTGLLGQLREGDRDALRELLPIIYDQLRNLARAQRRRQAPSPTLNTTALVHEAFLKLVGNESLSFHDRTHFMAVAATAMRQILIGHARRRARSKRGGGQPTVSFDEIRDALEGTAGFSDEKAIAFLALDRALARLQEHSERQSRIVECRFFGGMSIEETASALGISAATVKRDWLVARAWLYREMQEELG